MDKKKVIELIQEVIRNNVEFTHWRRIEKLEE